LGIHRATVREIAANRLRVGPIEAIAAIDAIDAIDGTAVVDVKAVLDDTNDA
jgi:tRNA (Thr-GGU) A37 N-methylase